MAQRQYSLEVLESMTTSQLGRLYQKNYLGRSVDVNRLSQLEMIVQVLKIRPVSEREEVYYSLKKKARAEAEKNGAFGAMCLIRLCGYYLRDVLPPDQNYENKSQDQK